MILVASRASCHVANAISTRLKPIWPRSSLKTSKMSKKCIFCQKDAEVDGLKHCLVDCVTCDSQFRSGYLARHQYLIWPNFFQGVKNTQHLSQMRLLWYFIFQRYCIAQGVKQNNFVQFWSSLSGTWGQTHFEKRYRKPTLNFTLHKTSDKSDKIN